MDDGKTTGTQTIILTILPDSHYGLTAASSVTMLRQDENTPNNYYASFTTNLLNPSFETQGNTDAPGWPIAANWTDFPPGSTYDSTNPASGSWDMLLNNSASGVSCDLRQTIMTWDYSWTAPPATRPTPARAPSTPSPSRPPTPNPARRR